MKDEGRPVDPRHSCADFRRGAWSLEEEPAVCESCEFFDENRSCCRKAPAERSDYLE